MSEQPGVEPLMDDLAFDDEPSDPNAHEFNDAYEGETDGRLVLSVDGSEEQH